MLTFKTKSIQTVLPPKNNETLQIIDFARFSIRLEFPPSDLGRIQTCNLLSRNQMRYSVAPRGLFGIFTHSRAFCFCPRQPRNFGETCNLLIRNQMRYSPDTSGAPRGLFGIYTHSRAFYFLSSAAPKLRGNLQPSEP